MPTEAFRIPSDDAGGIALMFPDGREVRSLQDLAEWEDMIMDSDTPEEGKHTAWVLANSIRAKFN